MVAPLVLPLCSLRLAPVSARGVWWRAGVEMSASNGSWRAGQACMYRQRHRAARAGGMGLGTEEAFVQATSASNSAVTSTALAISQA